MNLMTATSRHRVLRTKRWIQGRTTSSGSSRFLDQPSSTRRAAASPGATRTATGSTLRVAVQPHQQRTCFTEVSLVLPRGARCELKHFSSEGVHNRSLRTRTC